MMYTVPKVFLFFSIIGLAFSDMRQRAQNTYFTGGEELTFKVKYLFFNAAEARFTISNTIYQVQDRPTYKIDVYGRTLSIFKIFYVKDNWGSYLDTARLIPYRSYRHIEEGNYRKHEQVKFDHKNENAIVTTFDRDNRKVTDTSHYPIKPGMQDIVSGFYYLRTLDLSRLKKGEAITIPGFFDKKLYNIKLTFEGKERVKSRIGTFDTFVFSPTMPSNKLFSGSNPVKVWITDDKNRIPIKITANLVVGSLDMEITDAVGLRHP
ncbi:MAG TPA: DUF3108 domain-containing protein [Cyclobacteriaceae bacterium]|nr:DUF3108 domain-containing protein [Cyclobacteriaceae bacterium]